MATAIPKITKIREIVTDPRICRWWAPTIVLLALDGYSMRHGLGLDGLDVATYLAGITLSIAAFAWVSLAVAWLPRVPSVVVATLSAATLSVLLGANALLFGEFKQYTTPHMLRFIVDDPQYLRDYAATYGAGVPGLAVACLGVCLLLLWRRRHWRERPGLTRRRVAFLLLLPVLIHLGHRALRVSAKGLHVDALTATALAAIKYQKQDWASKRLAKWPRRPLAAIGARDGPDILLVLNESWDHLAVPGLGGNPEAAPRLGARMRVADRAFLFRQAFANATATDVSVPSILSGVGPEEDPMKLQTMPLIWDWAKAAGLSTLLVSSQRLTWNGLADFLRTPGLDRFLSAPEIGGPTVNDLGIDDLAAAAAFCRALADSSRDRRLLSVFNSNALHPPFQQTSPALSSQPSFSQPFDNAVAVLDQAVDTVIECALKRRASTVVLVTGDHGQGLRGHIPRLYSYYPDAVGVPMLVLLPELTTASQAAWPRHLTENLRRNVTNLDVAPTIVDLLGALDDPANAETAGALAGASLFRAIAADRPIVAVNTNDFKKVEHEGFGIYIGTRRLVVSDLEPPGLYDVERDPGLTHNLWPRAGAAEKAPFLDVIGRTFHLNRIFRRDRSTP